MLLTSQCYTRHFAKQHKNVSPTAVKHSTVYKAPQSTTTSTTTPTILTTVLPKILAIYRSSSEIVC